MFLPPRQKGRINLLTVLDMINFEKPFGIRNKFREISLRLAIKRADYYICISEATKEKLQTYFPAIKDHQIRVTHLGVDRTFFSVSTSKLFENTTKSPYLLYVGQRSGYKNFNSLVTFMAQSSWGRQLKILCVGGGPFSKKELMLLTNHQLNTTIQHVGYASIEDLKFLYQNALALTYTSLSEGFGLPVLEAMACGCPVICGNFSSMKEISDGHAILVDNFSVKSLQEAITQVSSMHKNDIERARLHAATFSWEKTAVSTLSLYAALCASLQKE